MATKAQKDIVEHFQTIYQLRNDAFPQDGVAYYVGGYNNFAVYRADKTSTAADDGDTVIVGKNNIRFLKYSNDLTNPSILFITQPSFFDDFNRADNATSLGTSSSGQVWTYTLPNVYGITSGKAASVSLPSGQFGSALLDAGSNDTSIDVDVNYPSGVAYYAYIALRAQDDNNAHYLQNVSNAGVSTFTFVKNVAGVNSSFSSDYVISGGISGAHHLKVTVVGSTYQAFLDGTLILTGTSSSLPTIRGAGIFSYNGFSGSNSVTYDNFNVVIPSPLVIPANIYLESLILTPTQNVTVNVGTTVGGTDVATGVSLVANVPYTILINSYQTTSSNIYLSNVTAGNVTVKAVIKKV